MLRTTSRMSFLPTLSFKRDTIERPSKPNTSKEEFSSDYDGTAIPIKKICKLSSKKVNILSTSYKVSK